MKKLPIFIAFLTLSVTAHAADSFSTLEERMTGKEFMETGLGKLTDEELAALNSWVRGHSVATLENATAGAAAGSGAAINAQGDRRGFEKQKSSNSSDDVITANIDGKFTGWSGQGFVFKLTNGMVWKQVESDTFNVRAETNPEVTIKKNLTGGWRLRMVGYNNTVAVKRVK